MFVIISKMDVMVTIFCFSSPAFFFFLSCQTSCFLGPRTPVPFLIFMEVFDSCNAQPYLLLDSGGNENRHAIN